MKIVVVKSSKNPYITSRKHNLVTLIQPIPNRERSIASKIEIKFLYFRDKNSTAYKIILIVNEKVFKDQIKNSNSNLCSIINKTFFNLRIIKNKNIILKIKLLYLLKIISQNIMLFSVKNFKNIYLYLALLSYLGEDNLISLNKYYMLFDCLFKIITKIKYLINNPFTYSKNY